MLNVASSCRTCMKDDRNLVNLFESVKIEEGFSIELATMLKESTTAQVSNEDGLPQNLCDECIKLLQLTYTFRTQVAKSEAEFKRLIQIQVKNEQIKCEIKAETDQDFFEYNDDYSFETFPKSEDENYEYNKCDTKDIWKHMLQEEDSVKTEFDQKYQCSECNEVFAKSKCLSMHMKKHKTNILSKREKLICDVCGKNFSMKTLLRRHLKLHSEDKPFKCTKCTKTYSRQDQLNDHMKRHDGVKPNVCSYCKKAFSQLCNLKDHLRTHTRETPYLCSQCGKGFSNSSNLRQHMMRHTGLKPYACNMCPKTFCTKGQMTSHITTHTGAHPYKCDECGAAFTKANSLKKHSFIHSGLRPFACDTCNMRFTCKDHLKRHYRIHTGERPYKCNICERAFSQSNDLVKHTRSHLGQNLYQCTICGVRFRLASELKLHYPVHFNGDQPNQQQIAEHSLNRSIDPEPKLIDHKQAEVKEMKTIENTTDGRFTITINSCDANGVVINISQDKS